MEFVKAMRSYRILSSALIGASLLLLSGCDPRVERASSESNGVPSVEVERSGSPAEGEINDQDAGHQAVIEIIRESEGDDESLTPEITDMEITDIEITDIEITDMEVTDMEITDEADLTVDSEVENGEMSAELVITNLPPVGYFELRGIVEQRVTTTIEIQNIGSAPASVLDLSTVPTPDLQPRDLPVDVDPNSSCLRDASLEPGARCELIISQELTRGTQIDNLIITYSNGLSDVELDIRLRLIGELPSRLVTINAPLDGYTLESIIGETAYVTVFIQNVGIEDIERVRLNDEGPDGELVEMLVDMENESTCEGINLLRPDETCTYIFSHTPRDGPYVNLSLVWIRYRLDNLEDEYLPINLRIISLER